MKKKIVKVEKIFKGEFLSLRLEKIKLGKEIITRIIVDRSNIVAILPLIEKDKIILVKHYHFPIKKYLWEIPAGGIEKNESPRKAAKRELEEEIGYSAKKLEKIGNFYLSPGYSTEFMHLFKATGLKKGKQKPERGEIIKEIKVFTLKEVKKMIKKKKIVDAKTVIAVELL